MTKKKSCESTPQILTVPVPEYGWDILIRPLGTKERLAFEEGIIASAESGADFNFHKFAVHLIALSVVDENGDLLFSTDLEDIRPTTRKSAAAAFPIANAILLANEIYPPGKKLKPDKITELSDGLTDSQLMDFMRWCSPSLPQEAHDGAMEYHRILRQTEAFQFPTEYAHKYRPGTKNRAQLEAVLPGVSDEKRNAALKSIAGEDPKPISNIKWRRYSPRILSELKTRGVRPKSSKEKNLFYGYFLSGIREARAKHGIFFEDSGFEASLEYYTEKAAFEDMDIAPEMRGENKQIHINTLSFSSMRISTNEDDEADDGGGKSRGMMLDSGMLIFPYSADGEYIGEEPPECQNLEGLPWRERIKGVTPKGQRILEALIDHDMDREGASKDLGKDGRYAVDQYIKRLQNVNRKTKKRAAKPSGKPDKSFVVECAWCFKEYGRYEKVPGKFICLNCNVSQQAQKPKSIKLKIPRLGPRIPKEVRVNDRDLHPLPLIDEDERTNEDERKRFVLLKGRGGGVFRARASLLREEPLPLRTKERTPFTYFPDTDKNVGKDTYQLIRDNNYSKIPKPRKDE